MPNSTKSSVERLSALIAEIEAEAYARGQVDARGGLLNVLAAGGGQPASRKPTGGTRAVKAAAQKPRRGGRKRAPRGSVRRFVEQAMRERPGSTAQEILESASTDVERSIALPSIRGELYGGRRRGLYESDGGRWALAVSDPVATETGEATSSDASPTPQPDRGEAEAGPPADTEASLESDPNEN